jgi:hypothetical protein
MVVMVMEKQQKVEFLGWERVRLLLVVVMALVMGCCCCCLGVGKGWGCLIGVMGLD